MSQNQTREAKLGFGNHRTRNLNDLTEQLVSKSASPTGLAVPFKQCLKDSGGSCLVAPSSQLPQSPWQGEKSVRGSLRSFLPP